MGIPNVRDRVIPKPVLIAPAAPGQDGDSLTTRYFMPHECHSALGDHRGRRAGQCLRHPRHAGRRNDRRLCLSGRPGLCPRHRPPAGDHRPPARGPGPGGVGDPHRAAAVLRGRCSPSPPSGPTARNGPPPARPLKTPPRFCVQCPNLHHALILISQKYKQEETMKLWALAATVAAFLTAAPMTQGRRAGADRRRIV